MFVKFKSTDHRSGVKGCYTTFSKASVIHGCQFVKFYYPCAFKVYTKNERRYRYTRTFTKVIFFYMGKNPYFAKLHNPCIIV